MVMKMSLEEAEALGVDLDDGYESRHEAALARWNAVKYREKTGASIRDTKVVDKIAEIVDRI
jgi:hypothetical protein